MRLYTQDFVRQVGLSYLSCAFCPRCTSSFSKLHNELEQMVIFERFLLCILDQRLLGRNVPQ